MPSVQSQCIVAEPSQYFLLTIMAARCYLVGFLLDIVDMSSRSHLTRSIRFLFALVELG